MKRFFIVVLLVLPAILLWSAPIEAGHWMQTSSTAGDCAECSLEIEAPTAHLRAVHASNGWVAYLRYDMESDRYVGFMELVHEPDPAYADWRGMLFAVEATMDEHTLTIHASSGEDEFRATYRME